MSIKQGIEYIYDNAIGLLKLSIYLSIYILFSIFLFFRILLIVSVLLFIAPQVVFWYRDSDSTHCNVSISVHIFSVSDISLHLQVSTFFLDILSCACPRVFLIMMLVRVMLLFIFRLLIRLSFYLQIKSYKFMYLQDKNEELQLSRRL